MTAVSPDGAERRWKANEFILRDANRWRGYSCRAGLESLWVRGSGEVVRATCGSGGRLGYLDQDIEFPRRPIVCDRDRCGCLFDILITKQGV